MDSSEKKKLFRQRFMESVKAAGWDERPGASLETENEAGDASLASDVEGGPNYVQLQSGNYSLDIPLRQYLLMLNDERTVEEVVDAAMYHMQAQAEIRDMGLNLLRSGIRENLDNLTFTPFYFLQSMRYFCEEAFNFQSCSRPFDRTYDDSLVFISITDKLHLAIRLNLPKSYKYLTKKEIIDSGITFNAIKEHAMSNAKSMLGGAVISREAGILIVQASPPSKTAELLPFLALMHDKFKEALASTQPALLVSVPDAEHILVADPTNPGDLIILATEMYSHNPHPVSLELNILTSQRLSDYRFRPENSGPDDELLNVQRAITMASPLFVEGSKSPDAYADALALLNEYLSKYDNLGARECRAKLNYLFGNHEKTIEDLENRYISADACITLGSAHLSLNQVDKAVNAFARSTLLRPDDITGYVQVGATATLLGDFASAIRYLEMVILLEPGFTPAYKMKALCHYQLGEKSTALSLLDSCLKMNPDDSEASSLFNELSK